MTQPSDSAMAAEIDAQYDDWDRLTSKTNDRPFLQRPQRQRRIDIITAIIDKHRPSVSRDLGAEAAAREINKQYHEWGQMAFENVPSAEHRMWVIDIIITRHKTPAEKYPAYIIRHTKDGDVHMEPVKTSEERAAREIQHLEGVHSICLPREKRVAELTAIIDSHKTPEERAAGSAGKDLYEAAKATVKERLGLLRLESAVINYEAAIALTEPREKTDNQPKKGEVS